MNKKVATGVAHDTQGYTDGTPAGASYDGTSNRARWSVGAGADLDLVSDTRAFADGALVHVAAFFKGGADQPNYVKLRLYVDGVQEAESGFLNYDLDGSNITYIYVLLAYKAMSGSKTSKLSAHNYDTATRYVGTAMGADSNYQPAAVVQMSSKPG